MSFDPLDGPTGADTPEAFRAALAGMSDKDVIAAYEAEEGEGPKADAAADEMERRNLDY